MRVLVCGGRKYDDRETVYSLLDGLCKTTEEEVVIIEGGATGADRLAQEWARARYKGVITVEADWKKHGSAAGPVRNELMLLMGKPDVVVAFPGNRGTADMVRKARAFGVAVYVIGQEAEGLFE